MEDVRAIDEIVQQRIAEGNEVRPPRGDVDRPLRELLDAGGKLGQVLRVGFADLDASGAVEMERGEIRRAQQPTPGCRRR